MLWKGRVVPYSPFIYLFFHLFIPIWPPGDIYLRERERWKSNITVLFAQSILALAIGRLKCWLHIHEPPHIHIEGFFFFCIYEFILKPWMLIQHHGVSVIVYTFFLLVNFLWQEEAWLSLPATYFLGLAFVYTWSSFRVANACLCERKKNYQLWCKVGITFFWSIAL